MTSKPFTRQIDALVLTAAGVGAVNSRLDNPFARGLKVVIDTTAITGTSPTLDVVIRGYDPMSGKYWTMLAGTQITATGTAVLTVYPGVTAAAGSVADDILPSHFDIQATVGGTGPAVTATISAMLLA